jgi:DnaJ-domain-containing protein 1
MPATASSAPSSRRRSFGRNASGLCQFVPVALERIERAILVLCGHKAMLSTVLNSPRAIAVNIEIMRAFVQLRLILASNKELARRLDRLEAKTDAKFTTVFEAIRQLMVPPEPKKRRMGFVAAKRSSDYRPTMGHIGCAIAPHDVGVHLNGRP